LVWMRANRDACVHGIRWPGVGGNRTARGPGQLEPARASSPGVLCLRCGYAAIANGASTEPCPPETLVPSGQRYHRGSEPAARPSLTVIGFHGFLHRAAASALRWLTGQLPCRKTGTLRLWPDRMVVATERCTEYAALSMGCIARLAFLTTLGVTARFTARPGCTARRTLRGMNNLEKKPTLDSLV
jgi:hypothetical protein